ncbi:hypothetical protein BJ912DRAFT_1150122 [Pholiota molesta]|nr:hypothetical protein BJ912DRAFT_1150122 [Pholiota molesta]
MAQAMHVRTTHGIISNAESGVAAGKVGLCDGGPCMRRREAFEGTVNTAEKDIHRMRDTTAPTHTPQESTIPHRHKSCYLVPAMAYEEIAHRPWRQRRATQDASWFPKYTAGMYSLGGIGEWVAEECAQRENGLLSLTLA